jgi:sialic acid synthase SpsE
MTAETGDSRTIGIRDVRIGPGEPTFIIAEIGINHDGDVRRARGLIKDAREAGANAVKMQTYITDKRVAKDSPLFGILKRCELSFGEQRQLFEYAESLNIVSFSTPFDDESVDFLAEVGVPCFKVASFDVVNRPLLTRIAEKGRPVIVSRGMATRAELDAAVEIVRSHGVTVALLHCVSAYPVKSLGDLNLATIHALAERYGCPVGFSDHTSGTGAAQFAVAAGAMVIEKHFTYSERAAGPDHALSMEPENFRSLVTAIRAAEQMRGRPVEGPIAAEGALLEYRRSR